jgi:hypothetical protein
VKRQIAEAMKKTDVSRLLEVIGEFAFAASQLNVAASTLSPALTKAFEDQGLRRFAEPWSPHSRPWSWFVTSPLATTAIAERATIAARRGVGDPGWRDS